MVDEEEYEIAAAIIGVVKEPHPDNEKRYIRYHYLRVLVGNELNCYILDSCRKILHSDTMLLASFKRVLDSETPLARKLSKRGITLENMQQLISQFTPKASIDPDPWPGVGNLIFPNCYISGSRLRLNVQLRGTEKVDNIDLSLRPNDTINNKIHPNKWHVKEVLPAADVQYKDFVLSIGQKKASKQFEFAIIVMDSNATELRRIDQILEMK